MTSRGLRDTAAQWAARLTRWLASERCFYVILGLLAFQALWLAFSAQYPMAFDENFHFGLIQLHAQQNLPFFTYQPHHADQYGAIVRDPSYLYHYLMSLPYRLLVRISSNQGFQIIVLRLINIALAVWGFILARRLLFRLGGSRALAHVSLLLVCLVPIVPFLAAQINYDNLFIPLTLWSLLATFNWLDELHQHRLSFMRTAGLLILLTFTSLVKYAFLPIAGVLGLVMFFGLWLHHREIKKLLLSLWRSMQARPRVVSLVALLLILSAGLFVERYGVNILLYHSLNPDCGRVLGTRACLSYSPWARDFTYAISKNPGYIPSKLAYLWEWPYGLWFRSFFALSHTYDTHYPMPLPGGATIALAAIGLLFLLRYSRRLFIGNIYRQTLVLALVVYLLALFVQTYEAYLRTGEPVAVNGRYLLPFLPAIFLLVGLAYRQLWQRQHIAKSAAVALCLILFLQGGGMLQFIISSKDNWYWQNPNVVQVNRTLRNALKYMVVGAQG